MLPSQYAPFLHEVGNPILTRVRAIRDLQQRRLDLIHESERMLMMLTLQEQDLADTIKASWTPPFIAAAVRAVR